jgi:hypothetical protein
VDRWVAGYEQAWRTEGTDGLAALFADHALYYRSPYHEPVVGLPHIEAMWEAERDGPDEAFTMSSEIVAVDGDAAVVRVEVTYGDPPRQDYRDLWVIQFDGSGRAVRYEEWPFWPTHGTSPASES